MRPLLLERFYARWEFAVRHNLSASDPEPLALRELLDLADTAATAAWEDLRLGYVEPDGNPELRAAIAEQYEDARDSDVTVTVGAQEAIYLVMRALVDPGDHVVVIGPGYQLLYEAPRVFGADVTIVPLEPGNGWALDVDAVRRALRPQTRLLIVNFPHNPTGSLPTRDQFEQLVRLCASSGVRICSDEVFRGLEQKPSTRLPAVAELDERFLSIGDLSKTYGLAGLRIGWIVTRDRDLLDRIALMRDYTTICGSAPSQILGVVAIRAREAIHQRVRSIVAGNLALLSEFMGLHADRLDWISPRAGTTAFPRLIEGDIDRFCERLIVDEGVLLAPGSLFDLPGGWFRIGVGQRRLAEGLDALGRGLDR